MTFEAMIEKTVALHQKGGLNCAQSILVAFGPAVGLDPATARALGRPLGGGVASQAGVCGYVTSALILLSVAYNHSEEGRSRVRTQPAVAALLKNVKTRCGHISCKGILEADMSTPEGKKLIDAEQRIAKRCYAYGREVAELLAEVLPNPQTQGKDVACEKNSNR